MSEIATIIAPFFGLVALGFAAGRTLDIPAEGTAGLNVFVFYFALPALFFQLVAETPLSALANWSAATSRKRPSRASSAPTRTSATWRPA
jgi:predicted permease